jgi:hypothetical protein
MRLKSGKWTEADNERLRDFVTRGIPLLRAAAAFNRTTTSVRTQARKIGCPFPSIREVRKKYAGDPASSWRQY